MISPGSANRSENGRHMNNENKNGKREYAPSCVTWHIACCGAPHCGGLLESVAGSPGPESGVVCHDRHPARYRDERRVEKRGGGGVIESPAFVGCFERDSKDACCCGVSTSMGSSWPRRRSTRRAFEVADRQARCHLGHSRVSDSCARWRLRC